MENSVAIAGNSGPKVRSDCEIKLEITSSGGYQIELNSKVKSLYGNSIKNQIVEILGYFEIHSARITVDDCGALPFVIAARLEAVIRELTGTEKEYLPPVKGKKVYSTTRDRCRFARLYLPGNNPTLMLNAGLHAADGIILDLEDSVAPARKNEARILVRNALRHISFNGAERMVRINQGERGIKDLSFIIPHNVNMIVIPKCETTDQVWAVEDEITRLKAEHGIADEIFLMPVVETALGIENVFTIAGSSENIVSMVIGLEDYTADIGVQRTNEGKESFFARARLVNACKAKGIQPIDSVFSDVDDMEALRKNVIESKSLGFEGMGCIHPRQIQVIREGFAPSQNEIKRAKDIIRAFEDAKARGLGVVALGSKMIDAPVVARAGRIITQAIKFGFINENWLIEESPVKSEEIPVKSEY
jgi:citrate lyase subunit beta/citryl-CoA lyase